MGDPDGTVIPVPFRVILAKAGIQNKKLMALALATGLLVLLGAGCAKTAPNISTEDSDVTSWREAKFKKIDSNLYAVSINGNNLMWDSSRNLITYVTPGSDVLFQLDESVGRPVISGIEPFTHGDVNYYFYDKDTFTQIGLLFVEGEGQANVGAFLSITAHATCEKEVPVKGESKAGILTGFEVSGRKNISAPMKHISTISLEDPDKISVSCMRNEYGDLYITLPDTTSTSIFGKPSMDGVSKSMFLPAGRSTLRLDFSSDSVTPAVTLEKPEIITEPDRSGD